MTFPASEKTANEQAAAGRRHAWPAAGQNPSKTGSSMSDADADAGVK
jgi:hypothetical protein